MYPISGLNNVSAGNGKTITRLTSTRVKIEGLTENPPPDVFISEDEWRAVCDRVLTLAQDTYGPGQQLMARTLGPLCWPFRMVVRETNAMFLQELETYCEELTHYGAMRDAGLAITVRSECSADVNVNARGGGGKERTRSGKGIEWLHWLEVVESVPAKGRKL